MSDELVLAYVAGFFDGEGCVCVRKAKPMNSNQNIRYSLLVTITNTDLEVLEYIQSVLGGVLTKRSWYFGAKKQCYNLYWTSNKGKIMLEKLLPYLWTKKKDAELGIEFQKTVNTAGKCGNQYSKLDSCELDIREIMYQASKLLKT